MWPFTPSVEIKSKSGVVHFRRWTILKTPWFAVYLHHILRGDEDLHPHNHPWNFISLILKGFYWEYDRFWNKRKYKSFNLNIKKAKEFHKLELTAPVWTLVFCGKKKFKEIVSDWGYLVEGQEVDHKTYRELKRSGDFDYPPDLYVLMDEEEYA